MLNAKTQKNDEFYTQYEDIQTELNHYEKHFKGKTVLCNCDDPFESNFCKFFLRNFNYLGLKRLICTSYNSSAFAGTELSFFDLMEDGIEDEHGYVLDVSSVPMKNGRGVSDEDIDKLLRSKKVVKELKGNGDFRSAECIEYLKQADIVVTNPPFSLFREYVATLIEYKKDFIILGNKNSIAYKEFFPLLKENKVWIGYYSPSIFNTPNGMTKQVQGLCRWFTNLDIDKRHEELVLYKHYSPEEYPTYDNYDAINVDKVSDIPMDYDGLMGVPITFLDKFNPKQFEIVASSQTGCHPDEMVLRKYKDYKGYNADGTSNGRTGSTCGNNPMLAKNDGKHAYYRNEAGHTVQSTFNKIFIRRKQ